MQLDDDADVKTKVMVDKLPCELQVDGFASDYAKYLELHNYTPESGGAIVCYVLLAFGGAFLALVGFLTLIFGPDTVTFSRLTGPTLLQFVQLYPGPIFTFGTLMVGLGRFLSSLNGEPPVTPEVYLLAFYELQFNDVPDDPAGLSIAYMDGDMFRINLDCA